jgi:hypothetical protein
MVLMPSNHHIHGFPEQPASELTMEEISAFFADTSTAPPPTLLLVVMSQEMNLKLWHNPLHIFLITTSF